MPAPKKIDLLPETIRVELNKRLKQSGFGDCRGLSDWLKDQGYEISKSSVAVYSKQFKDSVEKVRIASEQAAYLKELFPDDDGAMTDAILRRYATELFNYMEDFALSPGEVDPVKLGRVIKDISHASISQKKLAQEIRAEMAKRAQSAVDNGEWEQEAMEEANRIMGFR